MRPQSTVFRCPPATWLLHLLLPVSSSSAPLAVTARRSIMTALWSLGCHGPADFHGGVVPEGTVVDDCPLWPPSKSFPYVWRTSHQAEVSFPYRNQRYQIFCQPPYPRAPACDPGTVNGLHWPWTWSRSKWPKNVGQWRMHSGGECQQQHCLNLKVICFSQLWHNLYISNFNCSRDWPLVTW